MFRPAPRVKTPAPAGALGAGLSGDPAPASMPSGMPVPPGAPVGAPTRTRR